MKLSVIVPVYNLSAFIEECLISLLLQKCNFDYEVIACDDYSTDNSLQILSKLAKEYPHLKVIHNPENMGLAKTQKKLLNETSGQYIAYVDGDDLALPGKLQAISDYFDSHPRCSFLYHEAEVFDSETGKATSLYSRDYYNASFIPAQATAEHLIEYGCFPNASSIAFRRHDHLIDAVDEECKIILDHPWHILNVLYGKGTADFLPQILGRYRIHAQSFGGQTKRSPERREQVLADQLRACENAARFGIAPDVINRGKAHYLFATALYFLKLNDFSRFNRFISDSASFDYFFDERHRYAFDHKEHPQNVYSHLFETLS